LIRLGRALNLKVITEPQRPVYLQQNKKKARAEGNSCHKGFFSVVVELNYCNNSKKKKEKRRTRREKRRKEEKKGRKRKGKEGRREERFREQEYK
jgi:hypothetical protein